MAALTCLSAVAFSGLVPAWRVASGRRERWVSNPYLAAGRVHRLYGRRLLVVVEIALALVLLIGVGLLTTTLLRLHDVPLGFEAEGAEILRAELARSRITQRVEREGRRPDWELGTESPRLVRRVIERLEALPAVQAAGAVNILPFQNVFSNYGGFLHVVGRDPIGQGDGMRPTGSGENRDFALFQIASPGYFEAMGVALLGGRRLSWDDADGAAGVALVNETLARALWPEESPIGKRLYARYSRRWREVEVVGLVADVEQFGFQREPLEWGWGVPGVLYLPHGQSPGVYAGTQIGFHTTTNFVVRHRGDGAAVAAAMREIFTDEDAETPITMTESLADYVAANTADRRFYTLSLAGFSAVALTLAMIGIYGVMAFQVGQRTQEIGIRMALGARSTKVVAMVVGEGARVALVGVIAGLLVAFLATRILAGWLFEVTPTDPFTFVTLSLSMVGVALLACWIPARRAARVQPVVALRAD